MTALACIRAAWANRKSWRWRMVGDRPDGPAKTDAVQMWRFHLLRLPLPWMRWKGLRVGIHRIERPDNMSKGLHDHPWDFWSIVLWGGYTEVYAPDWLDMRGLHWFDWARERYRGFLSMAFHRAEYAHGIVALKNGRPCYTLFVSSGRIRPWGFPEIQEVADARVD